MRLISRGWGLGSAIHTASWSKVASGKKLSGIVLGFFERSSVMALMSRESGTTSRC